MATMTVFGVFSLLLAIEGAFVAFRGLRQSLTRRHRWLVLPPALLLLAAACVSSGALFLVIGVGGTYFGLGLFAGGVAYAVIEDGKPHDDGRGDDGGDDGPEPDPSWWPGFEDQFRAYVGRRRAGRPKTPAGRV